MAVYKAGRLGSITVTGGTWETGVQNWRLSESIELPDSTVLGDADDTHVIGILTLTITCEVLYDQDQDITELEEGTALSSVVLKPDDSGAPNISGAGTIQSVDYRADRRGAQLSTIVIKSKGAWVWANT